MIHALFIHGSADFSRLVMLGTTPETQVLEFKKQLEGCGAHKPDVLALARIECARDIDTRRARTGTLSTIPVVAKLRIRTNTPAATFATGMFHPEVEFGKASP